MRIFTVLLVVIIVLCTWEIAGHQQYYAQCVNTPWSDLPYKQTYKCMVDRLFGNKAAPS
jgi:hypothetical protein